ncbi:MAG: HdeD family acid-resistance protein [Candidatus Eremiobacteraeota bacterium]|nr:HdeD family acid-resistance protein [Candidatus Eremiobacteraeota bacterium]
MVNLLQNLQASAEEELHRQWGWYLALGILMVALGGYCIYAETAATVAAVLTLGGILIAAGAAYVVALFALRPNFGHALLMLLTAAVYVVVGLSLLKHPELGALMLTLFIAAFLTISGTFRFFSSLWLQLPGYGWSAFSGALSVLLGIMLWAQWPVSGFWFIGFAVGVTLIFDGASWCSLGLKFKSVTPQHA